jgi:hypothetical protein
VIEKYIKYEYEIAPWFSAMPEHMFAALEKSLGWHMLITARLGIIMHEYDGSLGRSSGWEWRRLLRIFPS